MIIVQLDQMVALEEEVHSGAASFRVASHDEKEFFLRFKPVADFIKSSIK